MILLATLALADAVLCLGGMLLNWPATPVIGAGHTALTLTALFTLRRSSLAADGWNGLALSLGAVLGSCGIGALALLRPWPWRKPRRRAADDRKPDGAERGRPAIIARLLDHRVRFPEEQSVESLATILRHGDLQNRCKALEAAVRSFEPRLSPLVAKALSDPDQTVRALAAATSAQVSANLATRIARIETKAPHTVAEQYEFAMLLFDNGIYNVLLSHSQRMNLIAKAREVLLRLLRKSHLLEDRGVAVSAALVRLGIDLALASPGGAAQSRGGRGIAGATAGQRISGATA